MHSWSRAMPDLCSRALGGALVAVAGLLAGGGTASAQSVADAASAAQPASPGAMVRVLIDAMKNNDGVRIRALFAPNASQAYGDGKPKAGPAFFAWLESDIIERKGQVDQAQFAVNGNEVIVTGQFSNSRGYRAAANFRIVVEQGRIVSWQMRY